VQEGKIAWEEEYLKEPAGQMVAIWPMAPCPAPALPVLAQKGQGLLCFSSRRCLLQQQRELMWPCTVRLGLPTRRSWSRPAAHVP
jgi:hypothetical protein